tara:strand:+ start:4232 stop:4603 length:372 start_codon:yes stop_codon:yes gene_type:complete
MKIEVSNGEILDKLSILEIKNNKIKDENKLKNIKKEYYYLKNISKELDYSPKLYDELLDINNKLWDIEDNIRVKEKEAIFDKEFIELARSVYVTNDKRCEIKKQININSKSNFIEEKSYKKYN